jgi:hypothetical protein
MAGWILFITEILDSKKGKRFLSGRFSDPDRQAGSSNPNASKPSLLRSDLAHGAQPKEPPDHSGSRSDSTLGFAGVAGPLFGERSEATAV